MRKLHIEKNPNVVEFMTNVVAIHSKFTLMTKEVFGCHRMFFSSLDKVYHIIYLNRHHPVHYCKDLTNEAQ